MSECLLCGANAIINKQEYASRTICNCPVCGVFLVSDLAIEEALEHSGEIASFLAARRVAKNTETVLISFDNAKQDKEYIQMTVEQIVSRFPGTFTERMDRILLNLFYILPNIAEEFRVDSLEQFPLFYLKRRSYDAMSYVIRAMQKSDLIEVNYYGTAFFPCGLIISPKGWDRIAELNRGSSSLNEGFLVLPRQEENHWSTSMRLAARKAIEDCGFKSVESISVSPDNSIGYALIAQIKNSRFVISDLSDGSGESYYSAALGNALGKVTILTCHNSERKNLKIKTDEIGVQFWKSKNDLYSILYNTIRALVH